MLVVRSYGVRSYGKTEINKYSIILKQINLHSAIDVLVEKSPDDLYPQSKKMLLHSLNTKIMKIIFVAHHLLLPFVI